MDSRRSSTDSASVEHRTRLPPRSPTKPEFLTQPESPSLGAGRYLSHHVTTQPLRSICIALLNSCVFVELLGLSRSRGTRVQPVVDEAGAKRDRASPTHPCTCSCRGRPRKPRPREILFGAQDKASNSRSFGKAAVSSPGQSTRRGADLSPTLPMMPNGSSRELIDMDSAKLPSGRLSTEVSLPSVGDVCEKRRLEKTISGTSYTSCICASIGNLIQACATVRVMFHTAGFCHGTECAELSNAPQSLNSPGKQFPDTDDRYL